MTKKRGPEDEDDEDIEETQDDARIDELEDDEDDDEDTIADEGVSLTGAQRRKLAALGHHLEPVVQIGKGGLTRAVLEQIDAALDDHELIKVKVGKNAPADVHEMRPKIAEELDCHFVRATGRTVLFYRPAEEPADRRIEI